MTASAATLHRAFLQPMQSLAQAGLHRRGGAPQQVSFSPKGGNELSGDRDDERHCGDNDTSPRELESDSVEARPGEARFRLGYAFGGFNVWLTP